MKVVITGDSGHVGGAIRQHLVAEGKDVVGISRRGEIPLDLGDAEFVSDLTQKVGQADAVVHCAAALSKGLTDIAVSRVNGIGTQNVIESAIRLGAQRLIYISGVPVIGHPVRLPIDEEHPVSPESAYHASKLFGEHLMNLANGEGLSTASLRVTSPIGPDTPAGRIFSVFVRDAMEDRALTLFGQGARRQNYIDVRDVASAVSRCLASDATGVFNVAGAESVSNRSLARCCIDTLGSESTIEFNGIPDPAENDVWEVSYQKANASFGYEPTHSLQASIKAAADSYASCDNQ
ncbi:MAG: SDR family oxidoreductase [Synoicihabitans sp.]